MNHHRSCASSRPRRPRPLWFALAAMLTQALLPALQASHLASGSESERASEAAAYQVDRGTPSKHSPADRPHHDESTCKLCRTILAAAGGTMDCGITSGVVLATVVEGRVSLFDRTPANAPLSPRTSRGPPSAV